MIIQYIIELLKNNDDIYINDLGLFEKKQVSAQMIEGVLYPPQNKIFFQSNAEGNGFAFILKYAEREQKRLNDADEEIRNWVEELKVALANNKSVHYNNFGTFSYNHKHEIIFESDAIRELNIDYEGMSPVKASPLSAGVLPEKEAGTVTEPLIPENEPTDEPIVENNPAKEPLREEMPVEQFPLEEPPATELSIGSVPFEESVVENLSTEKTQILVEETTKPVAEEELPDEELKEEPASVSGETELSGEPEISVKETEDIPESHEEIPSSEPDIPDTFEDEENTLSEKRKIKAWWFVLPVIILLLAAAAGLVYIYRVPLELTYREYMSGRKTGHVSGMYYKDITLSPVFSYQYNERVYDIITVPFMPGMETKIQKEELPVQPSVQELPADETANGNSLISASGLIKETGMPSSTPYPRIDYQSGKFYVIAGSFTNEQDAAKHIRQAKLESYDPYLLYQSGNTRVRVCIGVFADENRALGFAEQFNKNYWVLK